MKAIIAGGGIGGLTAALCLHRAGWDVCVVEQATELGDVGAGIQISPNASRILTQLGVTEALAGRAFHPTHLQMRSGRTGKSIFSVPVKEQALLRWGAPYLHLHRADLIAALQQTLTMQAGECVQLGSQVIGYRNSDSHVEVQLQNGSHMEADLLIGADGIHSAIRQQMLGDDQPNFTGNVAWRATVAINKLGELAPDPTACVWVGPQRHAVTYRLRGGKLANFVGVVERDDWQGESWTELGTREQALADFQDWHPTITNIIKKADCHYRWALFDRHPLSQWSDGHVALLGDACHPMLPFLAQGAAMAIEDGWVLAQALADQPIPLALKQYFDARIERTTKVQGGARANMKTFHRSSDAAYLHFKIATKLAPPLLHKKMDWLYGCDVMKHGR